MRRCGKFDITDFDTSLEFKLPSFPLGLPLTSSLLVRVP